MTTNGLAKSRMGQPPKRTPELDEELIEAIADADTIRAFARRKKISHVTIYSWLKQDTELLERVAHAREIAALQLEDEILEIADTPEMVEVVEGKTGKVVMRVHPDDVPHRKLRIYAREQRLAWNNPAKYGKKAQVDVIDKREVPEMTDLERATRVRQILENNGMKVVDVEIGEVQPEEEDDE